MVADGIHSSTGGWAVGEAQKEGMGEDGAVGPAKPWWGAIGWDSVNAHMAFRETEAFRELIPLLRGVAPVVEVHHVAFKKFDVKA